MAVQGTWRAGAGQAFALDFTAGTYGDKDPITALSLLSTDEVYVKPIYSGSITAPGASPELSSADTGTAYVRMLANEPFNFNLGIGHSLNSQGRKIIGLVGWAINASYLRFEGV